MIENKIVEFLEENTELIHIEFLEKSEGGYLFDAYHQEEMQSVSILVTKTNEVFANYEEEYKWCHLNKVVLPFNVWSA